MWGELAIGAETTPLCRELQREPLNRLANPLLRPQTQTRASARSLQQVLRQ